MHIVHLQLLCEYLEMGALKQAVGCATSPVEYRQKITEEQW